MSVRLLLSLFCTLTLALLSLSLPSSVHILQRLLIDYDRTDLPTAGPILVNVGLTVEDIPSLSETDGSFNADIRFAQIWNDPNLCFSHIEPNRTNITLDYAVLNNLWTPNICLHNSKRTRIHFSPAPNILLLISPDGTVWVSNRVRVEGPCEMDMSNFPMDIQTCQLVFESCSFNADEVQLQWQSFSQTKAVSLADYSIPEFVLVDVKFEVKRISHNSGIWDQLAVKFTFKRKLGYYMLQAYLPTLICVAVSWVSFYLDTTATPARATVGVSTLMALLLAYGNIASGLPRVSYLRALDIWMTVCMLFTFLTLMEFAVVGFIEKKSTQWAATKNRRSRSDGDGAGAQQPDTGPQCPTTATDTLGRSIDAVSAKAFPFLFLAFNIGYWAYYLHCYYLL